MPAGALVGARSALPTLVPVKQAGTVEQAKDETPFRHAHHFAQEGSLIPGEAQGCHGNRAVEAAVGKRQLAAVAGDVTFVPGRTVAGKAQPGEIGVEPDHACRAFLAKRRVK